MKAAYGESMKISRIPDVRIAQIDVQMMRCVREWIVTKTERQHHLGQNSYLAYGEGEEPQQNAHQTNQVIRVVGRTITVILKFHLSNKKNLIKCRCLKKLLVIKQ